MADEEKTYPVVDASGAPLYAADGDPILSNETPDSTTADGRPAVRASASNAPHDAAPAPATSESAPPTATDPGYQAPPSSAGDPAPASAPTSSDPAPVTQDPPSSTSTPASSDAPASDAAPAGQGSGPGSVPPATVTSGDLAASDPSSPSQASPPGTTSTPPAQSTDDPNTPQSVSTEKGDGQQASTETLNPAMTTTVDATTIAKAKAEQDAGATAPNTPAAVLGDAVAAATPAVTAPAADPDKPTLVLAPGTADGIAAAQGNGAVTQEGTADIGAGAVDASAHDVVATQPAAGNGISDGPNAGAVSPTGYVAPIRVSAAGVPADDTNLAAVATGDLSVTDLTAPPNAGPGTSDRPNPAAPSLGADASAEGTAARTNGSAQASPYVGAGSPPGDTNANAAAQEHALTEASTGAPRPATSGDTTLASPVAAGDVDAANKAASDAGKDAPPAPAGATVKNPDGSDAGPFPPPDGTYQPLKPQTPEDAAKVLTDADALPAPVAEDVKATTTGPQDVSELPPATEEVPHWNVTHAYEIETVYRVAAKDQKEAVEKVKAGDGVKVNAEHTYDSWDVDDAD